METKIRNYVEELFANAPKTRKALELKDEIMQNLIDKYRDLTASGQSEEAAYNSAINSIGDIDELLKNVETNPVSPEEQAQRAKHATLLSVAVMLYILAVVPLIVLSVSGQWLIGLVVMFVLVAAATGLIIYNSMTKPNYQKSADTMVEDFKEWNHQKDSSSATKRAISSAVWSITLVAYFVVSFTTGAWHITWVIFLIGIAVSNIISAICAMAKKEN